MLSLLFVAALAGWTGGYGGALVRARQLARRVGLLEEDCEGFDARLRKREGRQGRQERAVREVDEDTMEAQLAERAERELEKRTRAGAVGAPALVAVDGAPTPEQVARAFGGSKRRRQVEVLGTGETVE